MWHDKERVASARFGLTTQNSFPSTSTIFCCRACLSSVLPLIHGMRNPKGLR